MWCYVHGDSRELREEYRRERQIGIRDTTSNERARNPERFKILSDVRVVWLKFSRWNGRVGVTVSFSKAVAVAQTRADGDTRRK